MHLDLMMEAPLHHLLKVMDSQDIEKGLLILNLPEERRAFDKELVLYINNMDRLWVGCGLNIHDKTSFNDFETYLSKGINAKIKIHPHLFCITEEDIPLVIDSLTKYDTQIIVDSLYYGKEIEYHNGIKMGVAMARAYPNRKVVMAHSGSLDFLKCMMATRYMPNVYYDYSFIQNYFNKTSLRLDMVDFLRRTPNRIMFGSDCPSFSIANAKGAFYSIIQESGISQSQIEDVFYNNVLKVYD